MELIITLDIPSRIARSGLFLMQTDGSGRQKMNRAKELTPKFPSCTLGWPQSRKLSTISGLEVQSPNQRARDGVS